MAARRDRLKAKRNLLFISSYTGLGGGESAMLNLFGALDLNRFALHLLTPRDGIYPRQARALGVTTHTIPYRPATVFFLPALWARFPIAGKITSLAQTAQIDLIHSDYHTLPFAISAAWRAALPAMWTCMGWWFTPKPWQRRFFRRIDHIFAISHAVKDGFLGTPPAIPPARVEVLWLGVDPDAFHPDRADALGRTLREELNIDPAAPVVGMVGRFQRVKGYHHFFEAMRRVAQALPEVRFVIGGENMVGPAADQRYRAQMLAQAQEDPLLAPRVCFAGYRETAASMIGAADVVVCPSLFESFGMVHIESMACGRPLVSTNVGGPAETVLDGETGYLVPPARPDLLAEQTLHLLQSRALRERMGQAGRARVLAHFTVKRFAARFAEAAEALTAGGAY